jgi:hypothetical protein
MLCSIESMHAALVSLTGDCVQAGTTWRGTFTGGFEGGTMPLAPTTPLDADRATNAPVEAMTTVVTAKTRLNPLNRTRAPVPCCFTIPPSPLLE